MDIFDLRPEDVTALALVISIAIAKQIPDNDQLGILASLIDCIGDNLGLIQLQREALAEKAEAAKKTKARVD